MQTSISSDSDPSSGIGTFGLLGHRSVAAYPSGRCSSSAVVCVSACVRLCVLVFSSEAAERLRLETLQRQDRHSDIAGEGGGSSSPAAPALTWPGPGRPRRTRCGCPGPETGPRRGGGRLPWSRWCCSAPTEHFGGIAADPGDPWRSWPPRPAGGTSGPSAAALSPGPQQTFIRLNCRVFKLLFCV